MGELFRNAKRARSRRCRSRVTRTSCSPARSGRLTPPAGVRLTSEMVHTFLTRTALVVAAASPLVRLWTSRAFDGLRDRHCLGLLDARGLVCTRSEYLRQDIIFVWLLHFTVWCGSPVWRCGVRYRKRNSARADTRTSDASSNVTDSPAAEATTMTKTDSRSKKEISS